MEYHFHYIRDEKKRPFVTECLVYDPQTSESALGVAICSRKETPCKKRGREIAQGRAIKSMETKTNILFKSTPNICRGVKIQLLKATYMPKNLLEHQQRFIERYSQIKDNSKCLV